MFTVTVENAATEQAEQHLCNRIDLGERALGFPRVGTSEIHLYQGMFGRSDSAQVVQTSEPVRVMSPTGHWTENRFPNIPLDMDY